MSDNIKPLKVEVFKSWGEYVEKAENGKTDMPREQRHSLNDGREEFSGTATFKEAVKLARDGWKKGADEIKEISNPIFNHVSKMIERVEVNHDVEGHSIDVARFVDGEPEAWMKFEHVLKDAENGHRLLRIVYNMTASAMVSQSVITRRGAAVASLVELLEYSGYRVELILVEAGAAYEAYDKYSTETYIRLKEFDQPLDMPMIAFALAHPATLRRLHFSIMEQYLAELREKMEVGSGYGSPIDIQEENRGDLYLGRMHGMESAWQSTESAEAWVIEQLKKQGVSLNIKKA